MRPGATCHLTCKPAALLLLLERLQTLALCLSVHGQTGTLGHAVARCAGEAGASLPFCPARLQLYCYRQRMHVTVYM